MLDPLDGAADPTGGFTRSAARHKVSATYAGEAFVRRHSDESIAGPATLDGFAPLQVAM